MHFLYRYLRDNRHCFICQWPTAWIMPYRKMVSRTWEKSWTEKYVDDSAVGHCTLDCPQMAPWEILVAKMMDLTRNPAGGDAGLDKESNEAAATLSTGLTKTSPEDPNPVTAFLGPGMVMSHLLSKDQAKDQWRVFAGGKDGRIFPWSVPQGGHAKLGEYLEGILAVATFLRTGRIDSARALLSPVQAPSGLKQTVTALSQGGLAGHETE